FIISCGLTHALTIWTLWHPTYWLSGVIKAITAGISVFTAGALIPALPRLLALPNLAESQCLNHALQQEIAERQRTEASLRCYERIISATPDGICLIDRQSRYQIANDTYLKWHQKSADQVLGQPVSAVLGASVFEQKIRPHLDRCLAGEPSQSELWVEYPGLGSQFISVGCAPYEESDGTVSGMIVSLRNRTPLKQAEAALQHSEMTQRAILEAIPDLLIHLNREGIRLNFISGGEVHLLSEVNCALQQSIYDTLPRDLADLRMHYVHQAIATNQRQTYEHTIHTPQGLRYEETRVVKLNDQEALLMVRDITDRKQTEDQLRRYERIVSASSDGISLINRDYVYEIVNDTYLRYNHQQRAEIVGHPVADLLGTAVFERVVQPKLAACLAGETVQYEDWFEYSALGRQFVRVTYSPYRDPDGAISGVVAVTSNLTTLKQAEQALQESDLRFRGIFNQMYQFIGLLAPDGTLLEANRTALDFAAVPAAAVIGQPFWDAPWWQISAATQAQLRHAIARAAQGEFIRYEVAVQGGAGQVITIDFSLRPVFDEAGQVVLLIPEGRDISDRIQAEKQLELQAIITRNMAEGICLVQADSGEIVYANPKFERMFGYDPGELAGQHVSIVNYQDQSEAVAQELMAAVLTQGEHTYEIQNVRKDGTPFWCEATTSVFEHPDYGKVLVAV
ncbi:MAG TPA: PAS domain-containing protein, partial [Candidatus Obscuribacterales bacterium]